MKWREVEPGVFYAPPGEPITAAESDLQFLGERARQSSRGRARLCAHSSAEDGLHEMLICLTQTCYIRPHRHFKAESALVLRGECDLVLFDSAGEIRDVLPLGPRESGQRFFVRLSDPVYHTYVLRTALLFFLETTPGPLDRTRTEYAPWAPPEGNSGEPYQQELQQRIEAWGRRTP